MSREEQETSLPNWAGRGPFLAISTIWSYWQVDNERRLVADADDSIRAYSRLHAEVGERLVIEWAPGPCGERRTTISSAPVLRIDDDRTGLAERVFDRRLRRHLP